MLPTQPTGYLSVIASNFVYPIITLFESLEDSVRHEPNEVQTAPFDNGYSLGVITLCVLMVESVANRTQYMMKQALSEEARETYKHLKVLDFIKEKYLSDLHQKIEELFVLRDVIVHNHLWEANIFWDSDMKLKLIDAKRVDGFGDKKFDKVVDVDKRKTKILGLNVFPNRICRSDATIILKTTFEFLIETEKKDQNYFSVDAITVKYRGNVMPFKKFIQKIPSS